MNGELIKEVFSDEAYVKSLFESESWETAQASLKEKGIDLSIEELKQLVNLMKKKGDGELSEEELEEVSGGVSLLILFVGAAVSTVAGVATGMSLKTSV